MNNNNFSAALTITFSVLLFFSCKKEECVYSEGESISIPCEEICNSIEDFEDDALGTLGNWIGIFIQPSSSIISQNGNSLLYVEDDQGGSWVYDTTDFPANFIDAGCELQYDVQYEAGSSNSATTDNSVSIFQGSSPVNITKRAVFILKSPNLITSGDPVKTIIVPLELAVTTGTTLPSNAYGEWFLTGTTGPPYSPTQIADFNSLMQSNNGIGFTIDEGGNPSEKWYFDNFCIKNCCID